MAPSTKRSRRAKAIDSDEEEEEDIEMSQPQPQSQSQPRASVVVKESKSQIQRAIKARKDEGKSKSKSKSKSRAAARDEDEDEDELPDFDAEAFLRTNQPLQGETVAKKLGQFGKDWALMGEVFDKTLPIVSLIGVAVEDNQFVDRSNPKHDVDKTMRSILDSQQELAAYQSVLNDLRKDILQGGEVDDAEETYEKSLKKKLNEYRNQTSRQRYAENEVYVKFKQEVWEATGQGAMPPINQLVPREDGDSDDGSDIEVGGATQNYKCPLSLKQFVDPLTSKICGHSFERLALQAYIKEGRGRATCPVAGCPQVLSLSDFQTDKDLARRAKADEKRRKRREVEEEDEDMEVV